MAFGNADSFLPDRPGVGDLKYFRRRIIKLVQVGEINMRPDMIGAEIVDWIERSEIDFLRHFFSRFDLERRLSGVGFDRSDCLSFLAGDLKSEPRLPFAIAKIDIASGQVRDAKRGDDRFVSDVLQTRQFEIDLDLRFDARSDQ